MTAQPQAEHSRLHAWLTGRVQGVGFRAFVQYNASSLGLSGWVRNVAYDQVETVAEGDRDTLERFLQVISAGPRSSRVNDVRVEWETPTREFSFFEIRRSR